MRFRDSPFRVSSLLAKPDAREAVAFFAERYGVSPINIGESSTGFQGSHPVGTFAEQPLGKFIREYSEHSANRSAYVPLFGIS